MQSQMRQFQQPVFKPLNSTETSDLSSFQQSRSRVNNGNQTSCSPFQIAKPNELHTMMQQASRTAQQQDQTTGTERLSSLHAKLHQEADKIRKWKTQTEIELKQKEKKIQEASTTVESLRKSILDLQLQNENLSLKLKEEIDHREDILQRITSTRDLCNILKTHTTNMEEKLKQCETERTQLKYLEKEHSQQFEDLSEKFQKLELASVEDHNKLMNQLNSERDDRIKLEIKTEEKLINAEKGLQQLIDQCDDKETEIRELSSRLLRNEDKMYNYQQTIETTQKNLHCLTRDLQDKDNDLKDLKNELQANLKEKCELTLNLNNMEVELQDRKQQQQEMEQIILNNQNQFDSSLNNQQQELEAVRKNIEDKMKRIDELEKDKRDYQLEIENLHKNKDVLCHDKTDLEERMSDLQHSLESLNAEKKDLSQEVQSLQTHLNIRTSEIEEKSTIIDELQVVNETLQNQITQKEFMCNCLKDNLESINDVLKSKEQLFQELKKKEDESSENLQNLTIEYEEVRKRFEAERLENKSFEKNLKELKSEVQTKDNKLFVKDKEIAKLKKEIEKQKKEKASVTEELEIVQGDLNELRKEQENLNQEITAVNQENEKLKVQYHETGKNLNNERESKSKKVTDLETKQKELKGEITSKNKQIKEMEKELKSIKTKLNQKQKATEESTKQIEQLSEELKTLYEENGQLKKHVDEIKEHVNVEKNQSAKCESKVTEIKKKLDQALIDKNESAGKCEAQIAEIMATLQKYKQENQKIVDQKEKELESLRLKHEQSVSKNQFNDKDFEYLKKQCEELEQKIILLENEKREQVKVSGVDNNMIKDLKTKLTRKESEITDLKNKLEKEMNKVLSQTNSTQTSPSQVPVTPLRRTFIPTTPKLHPKTTDTPKTMKTPVCEEQTPQRSILRGINSISKKRRVAFIPDNEKHNSDSSSSELMEVEPMDIDQFAKGKSTPIHVRPSPKEKLTEPTRHPLKTPQLNRVPRGPPVKLHSKQQPFKGHLGKENDQYNALFPNEARENKIVKKKEIMAGSNMRKTPSKQSKAKFFSVSPKQRKEAASKARKSEKVDDMAWFDLDSVFGFGPED